MRSASDQLIFNLKKAVIKNFFYYYLIQKTTIWYLNFVS